MLKKIAAAVVPCIMLANSAFSYSAQAQTYISAKAAILIDADSGRIVYEKNAYERLPMASTTKIMTTLLTLESGNLDEYFTVDSEAIKVEGSSMGLVEGDVVTKRTLCYGMMLPSGNDAANASAVRVGGSISAFVDMMNERAEKIGLNDTHFVTPSGLDDYTDEHYSTAYDMAKLTSEALKNEEFRKICSTRNVYLSFGNPPYERWLANSNKLLTMYDGVIGVKTGFTDKAKRCLVSACERDGVTLICVTLNASNDWSDHMTLYDYGFSRLKKTVLSEDTPELNIPVVGGEKDSVIGMVLDEPTANLYDGEAEGITEKIISEKFVYAPIEAGDLLGKVQYVLNGRVLDEVELLAAEDVAAVSTENKYLLMLKNFLGIDF